MLDMISVSHAAMITIAIHLPTPLPPVALVGVVRRTGGLWSGLHTLRVRVDRVLRGTADGISRRSVQVVVSPGTDVSRLWRGQTVLLSGVPSGNRLFTMGSPIEDYASSLEREIVAC